MKTKYSLGFLLLAVCFVMVGCAEIDSQVRHKVTDKLNWTKPNEGGILYEDGWLHERFNRPFTDLHKATEATLNTMQYKVEVVEDLSEVEDLKHAVNLRATEADGRVTDLELRAVTERMAKIRIKVGLMGERGKAQSILDGVRSNLLK